MLFSKHYSLRTALFIARLEMRLQYILLALVFIHPLLAFKFGHISYRPSFYLTDVELASLWSPSLFPPIMVLTSCIHYSSPDSFPI